MVPHSSCPKRPSPGGRGLPRVLVAESAGFSEEAATILRQVSNVDLADLDRPELLRSLSAAELLWVRLRHRIDGEVFEAAPLLRAVATPTTGLNHVDLSEAERRGVAVLSLRGESEFLRDVRATAEHTMGLILALLRRIPQAHAHALSGGWDRDRFRGSELHGKTAGIVGLGRLGSIVARYLQGFGMRVLAYDPDPVVFTDQDGIERAAFLELLEQADIVTIHADLNETSRNLFGSVAFAAMKSGAILINTSRGEIVAEDCLAEALRSGRLAGAALDVLVDERADGMGDSPLVAYAREHDNLVITPHIGGATRESMEKTEIFLARKAARFLSGAQGAA